MANAMFFHLIRLLLFFQQITSICKKPAFMRFTAAYSNGFVQK